MFLSIKRGMASARTDPWDEGVNLLATITLTHREILRFLRERSRMVGVIASPILFWIVIGSGLNRSFQHAGGAPEMNYLEYFFPGSVVLIVLFASIFSSISVIEDRNEGFLQSVIVAPVSRFSIVLGKVAGISVLASLQGAILVLASPFIIPESTVGSMVLAVIVLSLLSIGLSSMGFALAWIMDSTQGFHAVMNLVLVPLWMLSGALFPASGASEWVAELIRWNPLTYGVAAVRESLYGLRPEYGSDLPSFGLSLVVLFFFAGIMAAISLSLVLKREKGGEMNGEGQS